MNGIEKGPKTPTPEQLFEFYVRLAWLIREQGSTPQDAIRLLAGDGHLTDAESAMARSKNLIRLKRNYEIDNRIRE